MLLLSPSKARKAASAGIVAFKLLLEGANTILGGIPLLLLPKWMTEGGWTLPLQQYYCIGEPFPFQTSLRSSLYSSFPARTHNWLWQQLMHCTAVSLKRGKQDFATTEQKHHTTAQNIIGFKRWQKYEKMALGKPLPFAKCQLCYSKPLKLSFGIFIDNFFDISNLPLTFHLLW